MARKHRVVVQFKIPAAAWSERAGHGDKRRIATVEINGASFHAEAIPVRRRRGLQTGIGNFAEEQLGLLFELSGAGAMQTINIEGRPHVVFLTPFED